ncbi:hypothetical protein [Bailinhaonella thermotolerans]|uniref:PknH-like extracellular domain-containing protein n=1 Tax=Bailinhaonella thermotolerans TaxID=1070861 RepID=A0A3A4AUQ4_9ACTN|nr:hypothetical protein [Bailinhaonella thermotolerans]RJL25178.1 hypothetical protein D5H75_28015 [Bailinhaonella thermotolerans]
MIRTILATTAAAAVAVAATPATAATGPSAGPLSGAAAVPYGVAAAPAVPYGVSAGAPVTTIPKDFLLLERKSRKPVKYPDEQRWARSSRTGEPLLLKPCGERNAPGAAGRAAARSLYFTEPTVLQGEQLVVYRNEGAARAAMDDLRAKLRSCSKRGSYHFTASRLRLGDEAVRVVGQTWRGRNKPGVGGERHIVVRRGSAIAVYGMYAEYGRPGDAEFRWHQRLASRMARKLCRYDGGC